MATAMVPQCLAGVHASSATCPSDSPLSSRSATQRRVVSRCVVSVEFGDRETESDSYACSSSSSSLLQSVPWWRNAGSSRQLAMASGAMIGAISSFVEEKEAAAAEEEEDEGEEEGGGKGEDLRSAQQKGSVSRRGAGLRVSAMCLSLLWQGNTKAAKAGPNTSPSVGTYLPSAGVGDLVVFRPSKTETPAIRAGNVAPYQFFLPPTWRQLRVANIQSGNYCQPKCAEPWVEVKFEDPKQGLLQVVAAPLVRLTNKPGVTIDEIGSPEKVIAALGPFVTGNSFDPDEVLDIGMKESGFQKYYTYTLETPFALTGLHNLAVATAKGNTVLLMVVSASQKQWEQHEALLREVADSFSV